MKIRNILFSFLFCSLIFTLFIFQERNNLKINTKKSIPIVAASNIATKIKPKDPGGQKFLNLDKTVYDNIIPNKNRKNIKEKIMPEPEQISQNMSSIFDDQAAPTAQNHNHDQSLKVKIIDSRDDRLSGGSRSRLRYMAQIGTSKTEEGAIKFWNKFKNHHGDLVDKYKLHISKIDTKFILYKIELEPFKNYDEARNLCRKIIARRQGCVVVEK